MAATNKRARRTAPPAPTSLDEYLALPYRLEVIGDGSGSFVVSYPELPGCFTQVERFDAILPVAREILTGWLEIALEDGQAIPLPRHTENYGGRILVRMPKSLHRWLAETAAEDNVSLNAHIVSLLAEGQGAHHLSRRVDELSTKLDALQEQRTESRSTAIRSVS